MSQPISRNSFVRERGYLGVYLQEGAPFVDAYWNESSDVAWSLLRDAIRASGLEGTAGPELRIVPVLDQGKTINLIVQAGPLPFYCNGLPIYWPRDRPIDAQDIELGAIELPEPEGAAIANDTEGSSSKKTWLDKLTPGTNYLVYLAARVDAIDGMLRRDLDDPGIAAERGSFRKRVRAEVRVTKAKQENQTELEKPPVTNLCLSVEGSYRADTNALFRVELRDALSQDRFDFGVLWDDAGGAVVALVTESGLLKKGTCKLRLSSTEGFAIGQLVRFEGTLVASPAQLYTIKDRDGDSITIDPHHCSEKMPAAENRDGASGVKQDVGLLEALEFEHTARATRLLKNADPYSTSIEVEYQPDWTVGMLIRVRRSERRDPPASEKRRDSISDFDDRTIVAIERLAGKPGDGVARMILHLDRELHYFHAANKQDAADGADELKVVPLLPIRVRRFSGHVCNVNHRTDKPLWPSPQAKDDLFRSEDDRRHSETTPDQPAEGESRPTPAAGLSVRIPMVSGLFLRFTRPSDESLVVVAGTGWSFAARAGDWYEHRVLATVEEEPESRVALARICRDQSGGVEIVDLRPVPASLSQRALFAAIRATALELGQELQGKTSAVLANELARCASHARLQPGFLRALRALANAGPEQPPRMMRVGRAWTELREAVSELPAQRDPEPPVDRLEDALLARIARALDRLARVLTLSAGDQGAAGDKPVAPPAGLASAPPVPPKLAPPEASPAGNPTAPGEPR